MALRVTRQQVEVAGSLAPSNLRVSRQSILVLYTKGIASNDVTAESTLALTDSADRSVVRNLTAENTLVLDQQAIRSSTELSASNTLVLTQTADVDDSIDRTASSSLSLVQSAERAGNLSVTASNSLTITQSGTRGEEYSVSASNTLVLTQAVKDSQYVLTASSSLVLDQLGHVAGELERTANNTLVLSESNDLNLTVLTASSTLELEQVASRIKAKATGITRTAENTLVLTQEADRIIALASGITLTATTPVTLISQSNIPKNRSGTGVINLTQSADLTKGYSASSALTLTQSAVLNRSLNITAASTLALKQSFGYEGPQLSDKQYSPQVGDGDTPIRTTPPVLTRQTDVELYYPITGARIYSVVLKTPDFGNRDRNAYSRINRESRGGSLLIYSDPKWPATRSLLLSFSRLKKEEAVAVQEFFKNTLGLQVGFRDWESRVWNGIILDPDTPLIHNVKAGVDLSFEFMAELADSNNEISQLSLTQSASVEVM